MLSDNREETLNSCNVSLVREDSNANQPKKSIVQPAGPLAFSPLPSVTKVLGLSQGLPEISTSLSPRSKSSMALWSVGFRMIRNAALLVFPHVSQITPGGGPSHSTTPRNPRPWSA